MNRKNVVFLLIFCLITISQTNASEHNHEHGASCGDKHEAREANKEKHKHVEKHNDEHKDDHKHGAACGDKHEINDKHTEEEHKAKHKDKANKHNEHDEHDDHDEHNGHPEKERKDSHDGHDHGEEEATALRLTPEQRKAIKLKISTAAAGDINTKILLPGEVKYNRDRMAQIMPQMPGFVSKVFKNAGDKIKAGEILATLQSHKLGELYAEYRSAKEQELLAKVEFNIRQKLWKKKAASERSFIQARQSYADSLVAKHRAKDKLTSLGLEPDKSQHSSHGEKTNCTDYQLKSPIDGVVISKNITIGENYSEDNEKVPFTVADLRQLWVDFNARQHQLPKLKKGMKVEVNLGEGFPDFEGKISYIAPSFTPSTRTVLVRVTLDNIKGILKPGLFATGVVSVSDPKSTKVVVPRSAILMIEGEKIIFIPEGDSFEAVPVKTGYSSNGFIEILSGLKPGDKYVSQGAFELKAVMITSGMDPHAGHGH